ncbi:hypothetical protein [Fluviispira multicolorata]|uniref:Uncharacterized protein n=1 Tax=Fluviispira multicolorata TaxID=2654512 RepID=A0A833N5A2_9BACT|nr:hypothetical protein [Fluviispira multicolorata]KAB8033159.1 hypothetical protein GCL57_00245 [Fluviispira multicolorata]
MSKKSNSFMLMMSSTCLLSYENVFANEKAKYIHGNNQTENLEASLLQTSEKKEASDTYLSPYGFVQFNLNVFDSTRSSAPDLSADRVRFGLKGKYEDVDGAFEIQFNGQTAKNSGSISVRKAEVGIKFFDHNSEYIKHHNRLSFGALRVGGAYNSAPYFASVTNKYKRQDGLYLEDNILINDKIKIQMGIGAFQSISLKKLNSIDSKKAGRTKSKSATIHTNWGGNSFNGSIGYLGKLSASYLLDKNQEINLAAYYGTQNNAPRAQNANGELTSKGHVTHIEGSLAYKNNSIFGSKGLMSDNGVSIYFDYEKIGKPIDVINSISTTPAYNDSQVSRLIGISLGGDTRAYLSNIIKKDDRIIYAISYAKSDVRFDNSATELGNGNLNYSVNQIATQLGYGLNKFEAAINYIYENSNENIFTNSDGVLNKKDNTKFILTGLYKF